jgi:hypothetical protein
MEEINVEEVWVVPEDNFVLVVVNLKPEDCDLGANNEKAE